MLNWIESLPVELVGTHIFGYLSIKDIVRLERASGSKQSHQLFLDVISHSPPVALSKYNYTCIFVLKWLGKRRCKIKNLNINPYTTLENLQPLLDNNTGIGSNVKKLYIYGDQNREIIEQLSICTCNVTHLIIENAGDFTSWLSLDMLSRWQLKEIHIAYSTITTSIVTSIVQTCTELASIKLVETSSGDSAVVIIAQHCPKLEKLRIHDQPITITSLLALSERGLPLQELTISCIPYIPNADMAKRCSHALSRIRHLRTGNSHCGGQDTSIVLPYLTGLTSLELNSSRQFSIPLITQHCHMLTKLEVTSHKYTVTDILSLCRTNPQLEEIYCNVCTITDTELIELIHACPHIRTLDIPCATDITDTDLLALSEHCPQLQVLAVKNFTQITEAAVRQLLQRCRKLS